MKNLSKKEYLFSPAEDFFKNLVKQEELEVKKYLSLSSILRLILNKIYSNLLKSIESISGVKLYVSASDHFPYNVSEKTKRIITNLSQKNIIQQIVRIPRFYPDEPAIIQYKVKTPCAKPDISLYSDGRGSSSINGGADLEEERALMKAVGEGLERFCLCVYKKQDLLLSNYKKISKKAVNPLSFVGISPNQRESNPKLKIDENSVFYWVKGFSLIDKKKVFIPAQLVYIGYEYHPREPIIQQQISTGAAAADSLEEALYRGICEAVERDAFMITYLNKLSPPLIDIETIDDENLKKLLRMFKRYNLDIFVIDITTDIPIPSIMAIIIDRTNVGPAIHVGTKTSLSIKDAISGAIFEVTRGRLGFRQISSPLNIPKQKIESLRNNPFQIKTFIDRSHFWALPEMIKEISFLFDGPKKEINSTGDDNYNKMDSKRKLKTVLDLLRERKIDIYGFDLTLPQIKEEGIYVAKVVSPQLQPLYLDEGIRHCWGERLFNVPVKLGYRNKPLSENELNPLPHPFL